MPIDVRQSKHFAFFMKDLGWEVKKMDNHYLYLKKFPLFGYYGKIPRPQPPFFPEKLKKFKEENKIFRLKISPFINTTNDHYSKIREEFLAAGFKIEKSPFNPTMTFQIDLKKDISFLFQKFFPAKRRGVRRALKNKIFVRESSDWEAFLQIRKRQYAPFGFLVIPEMKALWRNFYPQNASLILAYLPEKNSFLPLAGIFLLFFQKIAYYWYASSLPLGKKLFAPTLLVFEAFKTAKKRGCEIFDFEGIYDPRFPKISQSWRGFTKFKEGFGGEKVIFMENFSL